MLKNNSKLIAILAIIILFLATTFSFADNEINTQSTEDTNITSDDADIAGSNTNTNTNANTVQKDVYIYEDNVTIDYVVEGNLFIFGSNVTVNQYVEGDVFIIGSDVTLNSEVISGNVFSLGEKLTVNSQLYDLYAAGNVVTIGEKARIYRDAHIAASKINLYGAVVRNADLAFKDISFDSGKSKGVIYGNVKAESKANQDVFDGHVYGSIEINDSTGHEFNFREFSSKQMVFGAIMSIVFALIIFFMFTKLLPNFSSKLAEEVVSKKVLGNFGIGLLGLVIVPIISIILMILIITIPLAFILLAAYILVIALSNVIITIAISNYIIKKYNFVKALKIVLTVALVSLVLSIIGTISFVGAIVGFLKVTIALGLVIKTMNSCLFKKNSQVTSVDKIEDTKTEE